MSRTLVVTTTFPQYPGDPRGAFLARYWEARALEGESVKILAPHSVWCREGSVCDVALDRIAYAPTFASTLTGNFGILENIRARPWRLGLMPALWIALHRAVRREIERGTVTRLAAHMFMPAGWVVAEEAYRFGLPFELFGHGTDVDLVLALLGPIRSRIAERFARAQRILLPSEDKRERLLTGLPALETVAGRIRVETMVQCVATDSKTHKARRAPDEILYLGRLIDQKGVDDLLRAVASMPGRPLLHVAGDGPHRRRLEKLAARLGLRARFHGFVEGSAKTRLLQRASVLCVPSREVSGGLSEGAPLVIVEALNHRLPVVATRTGGIPELCRDAAAVTLVPAGRPLTLAAALQDVLEAARRGPSVAQVG